MVPDCKHKNIQQPTKNLLPEADHNTSTVKPKNLKEPRLIS